MRPKLLILSEDFPPYPGGIARWASGVACALARLGVEVYVLTRYRPDYPAESPHPNVAIHFVHGKRWAQFRSLYYRKAVKELLQQVFGIDTIVATTWNVARGIGGIAAAERIRLVTVLHGMEVTRRMPRWKRSLLLHTLYKSQILIAVSQYTAQQVARLDPLLQHKMYVFPNGVDLQRFRSGVAVQPLRERYGFAEDAKILLTLARVIERKGHDRVIQALPAVVREFPEVRYLICGPAEAAYKARLVEMVRTLGLESVVFFEDYVPEQQVPAYYHLCDIYIMIARSIPEVGDVEGFGITYLEANACGKPVIAGKSGGVCDAVIDGVTGMCVDPDDIAEITAAICRLLREPALAHRLGKAGQQRVERELNWMAITEKMLPLLWPFAWINLSSSETSTLQKS